MKMNTIFCILASLFIAATSFAQKGEEELNIISSQKGIKLKKPPMSIYWFMKNRETECDRLFWFKDKLTTPLRGKLHYHYKRVDLILKYDDFFLISLLDYHRGRDNVLILLDKNFDLIEEYVFAGKKKNSYRNIKERIKSEKIKTKTKFLEDIEEFEKTIPNNN